MPNAVSRLVDRARRSLEFRRLSFASEYWRKRFSATPPDQYVNRACGRTISGVEIVSLCHKEGVPLASLCMLSFLRNVGTPTSWNLVSDGSMDESAKDHLRRVCPNVRFTVWSDYVNDQNRPAVDLYLKRGGMAKKLALMTGLPAKGKFLYTDTDVVFFQRGAHLHQLLQAPVQNRFLLDNENGPCHAFHPPEESNLTPVNAGFVLQVRPVPWQPALDRLVDFFKTRTELLDDWKTLHHLEQSVSHLGYNWSGAEPFPPQYVLRLDDAYELAEPCIQPDTVMRHYVVHTRMKFWLHAKPYLS